jgi:hypothetical protein
MSQTISKDEDVLTCVHVLNRTAKYEYIPEQPKTGGVESFTCSTCLDNAPSTKHLRVVCKDCFVNTCIEHNIMTKLRGLFR